MSYLNASWSKISLAILMSVFISAHALAQDHSDPPPKDPPTSQQTSAHTSSDHNPKLNTPWKVPDSWFIYLVLIAVLLGSLISIRMIGNALSTSPWSLSDALSEDTQVTATEVKDGVRKPLLDATGNPISVTEMHASSSRLIALMGMMVILLMFLGFGMFALYGFAETGTMPESMTNIREFLLSGLALFAPYAINKFSKVFESVSPKKP